MKPNPLTKPSPFYLEDFSLLDVVEKTTVDPYLYLKQPEFGFPSRLQCLPTEEGIVDFLGCIYVNSKWHEMVDGDGNLVLKAGQCRSISQQCCQCTICAPKSDIILTPGRITDLLFWKFSDDCLYKHVGAVYINDNWDFMAITARPPRCYEKGHRPDPAKKPHSDE
ncbi:hypothetical protein MKX08_002248 [Trichoderma sp. CBMAI-0020]|nr:hypothetical protein MKX08_002248 [Trichoderma sp. CBMAI-0020]